MSPACTSCPARSTSMSISASPATPTRRIGGPAPPPPPWAARPRSSRCRTPTRRPAAWWNCAPSRLPQRNPMSISASTGCWPRTTSPKCPGLIAGGVNAFKCFMGNTFGNLPSPSTGAMLEGFEVIAPSGLRISLHAEDASIMAWRQARLEAAGRNDPLAHIAARPAVVAVEAVRAPRSSPNGPARGSTCCTSPRPRNWRRWPMPRRAASMSPGRPAPAICCSTAATMQGSAASSGSTRRCGEAKDSAAIWAALHSGLVDMIATDHAPHLPEEKMKDIIWQADCGFPGVETQMPLMLNEVAAGRLTLEHYVRLSAEAPARAFGLWPWKGRVEAGALPTWPWWTWRGARPSAPPRCTAAAR